MTRCDVNQSLNWFGLLGLPCPIKQLQPKIGGKKSFAAHMYAVHVFYMLLMKHIKTCKTVEMLGVSSLYLWLTKQLAYEDVHAIRKIFVNFL